MVPSDNRARQAGGGSSDAAAVEDCLICIEPMCRYDYAHPIQCSHHCGFNFCLACLEGLIKSNEDDYAEASDGNFHVKVFLHCPNCRSNLGPSIRDTALLRRVDRFAPDGSLAGTNDSELSATELRFKHAITRDLDVKAGIKEARVREREFFGEAPDEMEAVGAELRGPSGSYDDEEGVEADLEGVHKSFICHHHGNSSRNNKGAPPAAAKNDKTLLGNMDLSMSEDEQEFVTSLMSSGDRSKLAAAAEMMRYISSISFRKPGNNLKKRKTILQIVNDAGAARREERRNQAAHEAGKFAVGALKAAEHRRVNNDLRRHMEYMMSHPLPVRMPLYAELRACVRGKFALTFVNDSWDGTVLDAFSKISVSTGLMRKTTVSKKQELNRGIRNVINAGFYSGKSKRSAEEGVIDVERSRVIVASIKREGGRQGIVKGYVVTHYNGEEFSGTAEELESAIEAQSDGAMLTFVFNADAPVAEALRRRSLIVT